MRSRRLKNRQTRMGLGILLGCALNFSAGSAAADPFPREMGDDTIPPLVALVPFLPESSEADTLAQGTFTLVATHVPVDELLPSLARKAGLNLDLPPTVQGNVTLNLTNRPLNDLLEQIAQQTGARFHIRDGNTLAVTPGNLLATTRDSGSSPDKGGSQRLRR
ncbi:MAG: hypothetical protein HQL98_07020 [Magnetococcales bacterium]|nr:hypothetical protein [Magnetococcales bacterium]